MKSAAVPITVAILTHRHDERFKQAVASAQPAKEVLIIDFDSKNNWQALKKQWHFKKMARRGTIKNFSAERNAALKKAKYDWVLFLDSDETIEKQSWPLSESLIREPELEGVFVRRRDVFYGRTLRFGETGNVWLLRLMKKTAAKFVRPVHEVAEISGNTRQARIFLKHFAHSTIKEFIDDLTQYARIEAEYQQDGRLPTWLLAIKTVVYPKAKFLQNYFFRFGFLDGWRGLVYAIMMSFHSLFVRVFSYENR